MRFLLLSVLIVQSACVASTSQSQVARRVPLQKSPVIIKSPATSSERILRYDPKTNQPVFYNPKSQVVAVDEKAGRYAFKWIGYDGKEKIVPFQRSDAIDVVVSVWVTKKPSGQYFYSYRVKNLPSSATYLSRFIVQNYASDVNPVKENVGHVGRMSNMIHRFKDGNWVNFGMLDEYQPPVAPGREIELQLVSSGLPGLVGCSATGGELTLKGVGEDMPPELEDAIPGYEEFPRGYTVGPIDKLNTFSQAEKIEYLLTRLPQFQQLGWVTEDAARRYERGLKRGDVKTVLNHIERDLKSEQITSEVVAMLQALKPQ